MSQVINPTPLVLPDPAQPETLIVAVIDRSISMKNRAEEVIEGFNAFIEDQKKMPGVAKLTLVMFNDYSTILLDALPIERFNNLDRTNYVPNGNTALLDAIGGAINTTGFKATAGGNRRVIFVIQTDGEENSSRYYDNAAIKRMIETRQGEGWTFVFLGANINAFDQARSLGIATHLTANYSDKVMGQTRAMYSNVSASVGALRSGASGQSLSDTLRHGLTGNDDAPK